MPVTPEIRRKIFEEIKTILQQQSPPMLISKDTKDCFELTGNKPVAYGSTKKIVPGMYFSSVIMRKDMVSFHFFPIYMRRELFETLIPNMIKHLKGKSCFNITKPEQVNKKELTALIKKGIAAWRKLGYIQ